MQTTLVIGANGKIGWKLVNLLAKEDLPVRAMARYGDQLERYEKMGVEAVLGDLERDFSTAFDHCDKVVFTAGSGAATGADKTLLVDLWGAIRAIDCAVERNIGHFIMISSLAAGNPDQGSVSIKHYLVAKFAADEYLKHSGLAYTILRPGRLTDDPATDRITTERPETADARIIPRADVAAAVLYCLENKHTKGKIIDLCQGTTPLADALSTHR